ncbi:YihY/virulence factor BrkB family protein [Nonomuraea sp. FMUSA5-5]|uniref:YihY/virulence factor BrkB family protein n=1 Tax=Nonomuraea composti TaxID=2720023 RepID=A0ABX1BAT1_9ACTN|nr:YihY/virulence factor BrkB family protein [Nonomuraea sp. FMUSA5-5]NJP93419.1 YihY/virulence factor BrkB family protein [Nonomuraea sp. FMUSA5-5]
MASLTERVESVKAWGRRKLDYWRVRRLSLDHLIRAAQRYQLQSGDRLAGAVTYFAFLSFFPLLVLGYSVLGFVVATSETTRKAMQQAIAERLPGIMDKLDFNLEHIAEAKMTAGIIGLLGLLYAGLGALDALRGALREMSMTTTPPLDFFLGKLRDLASLLLLGVTAISSVLIAGFATTATDHVMKLVFGGDTTLGRMTLRIAGVVASVGADWLLFVILLGWVARPTQPFRVIAKGALLGAISFGVLKQIATLLLASTMGNVVYGAFTAIAGLLVWMNFSARLILFVAAWTATSGLCPPPAPSPIPSTEVASPPGDGPAPMPERARRADEPSEA